MIRAFLAVPLNDAMRARYAAHHAEALRRYPKLRWVRPENVHVTLRFLGESSEETLERLRAVTQPALSRLKPFQLSLGAPGAFGPRPQPRTLWIGLEKGAEEMKALAGILEAIARNLGFEPDEKPWSPHITVARNPDHTAAEGCIDFLASSGLSGMALEVADATLFSSNLLPGGPKYATLWKARLSAAPP